jgi:hypothetical protein
MELTDGPHMAVT